MIESIKKAFVLSVKALKLFYVIAAFYIIAGIINLLVIPAPVEVEMTLGRSLLVIALTAIYALVAVFITSGALAYVKELIKAGAANLASFISNAKKYFLRLLAVSIIIFLLFLILGILLFGILGFLPIALKWIIGIAGGLILIVLFIMPPYALIGSDLGVINSIKKGVIVGKKNFLRILGLILIMLGVYIVVLIAAAIITGILSFILRPIASYIAAVIMAIANAVMFILLNIAYMDFYLKSAESVQESIQV